MGEGFSDSSDAGLCPQCGRRNKDGARYCSACGIPLDPDPNTPQRRWLPWLIAGVAVVLALAGMGTAFVALSQEETPPAALPNSTTATVPSETTAATTTTAANAPELGDAALATQFGDAVFKIETTGCGFTGVGSGFAIDEHHIVTNRHVVDIDATPSIQTRDGQRFTGRVIGWRETPDVAVIEVDRDLTSWLSWTETSSLAEGQRLVSLGYPLPDHDFSVTPGVIVSFITEGSHRSGIRSDAQLDRGNSGGPSLISDGRVAGVVTQMDLNLDGFQFVPIIMTVDEVAETIEWIMDHPSLPRVDCDDAISAYPPSGIPSPPTSSSPSYEHPVPPFYTVILASMKTTNASYADAWDRAQELAGSTGLETGVLLSDDFSSLNPGYWVAYTGVFYDRTASLDYANYLRTIGIDGYARQVEW